MSQHLGAKGGAPLQNRAGCTMQNGQRIYFPSSGCKPKIDADRIVWLAEQRRAMRGGQP